MVLTLQTGLLARYPALLPYCHINGYAEAISAYRIDADGLAPFYSAPLCTGGSSCAAWTRAGEQALADDWQAMSEDGHYAFNDAHALLALLGAGRSQEAERLLGALEQRANGAGTNAMISREVGVPLARALCAFHAGRYRECCELLLDVRSSRDSPAPAAASSAEAPTQLPFLHALNECHLARWLVEELQLLGASDPSASVALICRVSQTYCSGKRDALEAGRVEV